MFIIQQATGVQQRVGHGGILLLIIIALIVYVIIKRFYRSKKMAEHTLDEDVFCEGKHVENHLYQVNNGGKMYRSKSPKEFSENNIPTDKSIQSITIKKVLQVILGLGLLAVGRITMYDSTGGLSTGIICGVIFLILLLLKIFSGGKQ